MKTREEVKEFVFNTIEDKTGLLIDLIGEESHLNNDLGFDSLDEIELIMDCEYEYNLSIPDTEAEEIKTVKEVVEALFNKVKDL